MRTGKVISLAVGGTGNRIYKFGDTVNEQNFPIGNFDRLIADGHIKEDGTEPEEVAALSTTDKVVPGIDDVSKTQMIKDLTVAEIGFDEKAKKEVLYDLWLTLNK